MNARDGAHAMNARDGAQAMNARDGARAMNRLYVVESAVTFTGAAADHRLAVQPSQVEAVARALARRLGLDVAAPARIEVPQGWLDAVADDLLAHRGRALVVAGEHQPAAVTALALAINERLDGLGRTVVAADPIAREPRPNKDNSLAALAEDMAAGAVDTLFVLGGNPVYDAPADIDFGSALSRVPNTVHFGEIRNETGMRARWHLPAAHELESWSDARAFDGTATVLQPLIRPLFGGRTVHEVLASLLGPAAPGAYELVRSHWLALLDRPERDFEALWRRALHDGVVPGSAAEPRALRVARGLDERLRAAAQRPALRAPGGARDDGFEIGFRPDPAVWDGRFANNAWLQEWPKPLTKLVWDNAAMIAPQDAEALGLANGDVVELAVEGRRLNAPVWIEPGQPGRTVTLSLGYGRAEAGRIGSGIGVDAYALRSLQHPWFAPLRLRKATAPRHALASTQQHHSMEGRHPVRRATLATFLANPDFVGDVKPGETPEHSLYPQYAYEDRAWGMVIDPTVCIGCGACVTACQAENNIPVVGAEEVRRGHEMHWLRVDRYYHGSLDAPEVFFQPVPCMHCEKAPCEVVCPVNATVHTDDGLNAMIYNRCVGTRYCSQNCPYKVRRFNWLNWNYAEGGASATEPLQNPDVSVRSRGVMEKCTYCVQRIRQAVIEASAEQRDIAPDAVKTACQQACPTEAIVFGDLRDEASAVSRLRGSPLNYALLAELNTRPRTTYLGLVRNPNPALTGAEPDAEHGG
jgi:molybdopterin-containing oxidoreductase family iron-sulfur binding subunit